MSIQEENYYEKYCGPPIKEAKIDDIDVTDTFKNIYSNNYNWQKKLWTLQDIFSEQDIYIGKTLTFIFDNPNPHFSKLVDYTKIELKTKDTIINLPLAMPFSKKNNL